MEILRLVFAGTATAQRAAMSGFAASTLGLERVELGGGDADVFALPDGSHFAVAGRATATTRRARSASLSRISTRR